MKRKNKSKNFFGKKQLFLTDFVKNSNNGRFGPNRASKDPKSATERLEEKLTMRTFYSQPIQGTNRFLNMSTTSKTSDSLNHLRKKPDFLLKEKQEYERNLARINLNDPQYKLLKDYDELGGSVDDYKTQLRKDQELLRMASRTYLGDNIPTLSDIKRDRKAIIRNSSITHVSHNSNNHPKR